MHNSKLVMNKKRLRQTGMKITEILVSFAFVILFDFQLHEFRRGYSFVINLFITPHVQYRIKIIYFALLIIATFELWPYYRFRVQFRTW